MSRLYVKNIKTKKGYNCLVLCLLLNDRHYVLSFDKILIMKLLNISFDSYYEILKDDNYYFELD